MQRILLYEFVTSGGTFGQSAPPSALISAKGWR